MRHTERKGEDMTRRYGEELVHELEQEIEEYKRQMSDRARRIDDGFTDMDDCFLSQRCEERGLANAREKIDLIRRGGTSWFIEYATLDGELVEAHWCKTRYGSKLRAVMPDGQVVWTSATTKAGLAKKGLKAVRCRRPAWFKFSSGGSGLFGVYSGTYVIFPSDFNYATGEDAQVEPLEIEDAD